MKLIIYVQKNYLSLCHRSGYVKFENNEDNIIKRLRGSLSVCVCMLVCAHAFMVTHKCVLETSVNMQVYM